MSILEQYVPAGYKMMESGDFFVTEGGQEDITVEKINETVTVSVAFKNEWGFVVGGGYYIVPAGEQDVSVLAQYVPAGYVLDEEGTINFVDGQHYDISVKSDESIVNIQFIDREGNVIAGGDYFVPTGCPEHRDPRRAGLHPGWAIVRLSTPTSCSCTATTM